MILFLFPFFNDLSKKTKGCIISNFMVHMKCGNYILVDAFTNIVKDNIIGPSVCH